MWMWIDGRQIGGSKWGYPQRAAAGGGPGGGGPGHSQQGACTPADPSASREEASSLERLSRVTIIAGRLAGARAERARARAGG